MTNRPVMSMAVNKEHLLSLYNDYIDQLELKNQALLEQAESMVKCLEYYKETGEHFGSNDGGAKAASALKNWQEFNK